jgi:hypothetical protein
MLGFGITGERGLGKGVGKGGKGGGERGGVGKGGGGMSSLILRSLFIADLCRRLFA